MQNEANRFDSNDITTNKGISILSYLSILVLVPLLAAKNSPFARFHANQGLLLLILSVSSTILNGILSTVHLGWIGWIVSSVIGIFTFVCMILGIVNAAQGRAVRLPIIGNIEILH